MIRPDFFELVDYAVDHGVGVKFSTNGTYLDAAAARRLAAMDYVDVQISLDGADAADQRRRPRRRLLRHGPPGDGPPGRRRLRAVQDQRRRHPPQRRPARRLRGARRRLRRPAAPHPPAAVGPGRRHVARAAPDRRAAVPALPLAARPRRGRAHRRLVLPPLRARRAAARAQPVRRRPRGVPDRPDRRRLRLPVRASTTSSRPARVRDDGGFTSVWRESELFLSLREPQSAGACACCGSYDACQGGCMAAKFFTGLPLDGPDPECVNGHGEAAPRRRRRRLDPPPGDGPLPRAPSRPRSRSSAAEPPFWSGLRSHVRPMSGRTTGSAGVVGPGWRGRETLRRP